MNFIKKLNPRSADEIPEVETAPAHSHSSGSNSGDLVEKQPAQATTTGAEIGTVDLEASRKNLELFEKEHAWDPNLPRDILDDVDDIVAGGGDRSELDVVNAVRAAVRNYDEDVPANTIRAWVIGLVMTTIGSGLNMLFSMRSPSLVITSILAQLVSYFVGVGWEKVMPNREFNTFGLKWNLNPGPFNMKEHAIITVMANVNFSGGAAYSTDTILAQRGFYGQNMGWGFELLLTLSTQCIGFGLAGIWRRFLVEPAAMIWPTTLVNTSLFYALHDRSPTDPAKCNGWKISRFRYFSYCMLGSFVWYWFPGYIFQALSVFAFVTWIRPNSPVINQIFGGWTGVSILPITFDWTQVTGYIFSPLISPWHAIANTLIGLVIFFWITTLGLHYSNHWYAEYLPISDSSSYDNTQSTYNVTKILTPDFELDVDAYHKYSPLFLSTTFSLCYGLSFAAIAAVITHTALFHGREIWMRVKQIKGEEDCHMRMMKKYARTPQWWFIAFLLLMFAFSLVTCLAYETHLTWWALIIAILIAAVWSVPIGMIQAITNIQLGLNVFTEFIIGYMLPGRPLAMMLFKTYGYITMVQCLAFTCDLKLGHYMKVPPRSMFWAQVIAGIWGCFVQIAVLEWGLTNIRDVCSSDQINRFTCPNGRVFFNASIIWGLIGPKRMFSPGSIYAGLLWFWLAGAIVPFIFYFGARMFPKSNIRYLSAPIIFGGLGMIPPATPLNYLSWGFVGWFFNKYVKTKYRGWWMRFNYLTSGGLDVGLCICTIIIIAALNLTNTSAPAWWGNDTALNTMDYVGTAIQKTLSPGEIFGPTSW
ncbi:MAG: hypothetical protein M1834_004433 [Cirrosporium novae-zelandiae]|nr:MAG: hypothetical protein M1834_004433 [Cirrosporium novae-zelandiae]